jgi:protein SCO1/2
MSKGQKTLTTVLWATLVLAMVGVISAGLFRPRDMRPLPGESGVNVIQPELNVYAPDFVLINEEGKTVSTKTLKGSVWIAEFIFTHCAGPCKEMTAKFNELQTKIADKEVKFVSISVDPDRDTPEALKAYGKDAGAIPSRWSFLTGDKSMVYATARGMLVNVIPPTEDSPLMHSEKFILVDANGKIRSVVDSKDDAATTKMIRDAETYAAEARKAASAK